MYKGLTDSEILANIVNSLRQQAMTNPNEAPSWVTKAVKEINYQSGMNAAEIAFSQLLGQ
jgi:hypothetical protein